jgi:Gpi18-like mannosyltransferase
MQKITHLFKIIQRTPIPFILTIFLVSRIALLIAAWFAGYYLPNPTYQVYVDQGWFLSPHFLIDIWSRWDAKWYLDIVMNGYSVTSDIQTSYSTVAFFPLFPLLVKGISYLLPKALLSQSVYLLLGLAMNNLFFLSGLYFLYQLTDEFFHTTSLNKAVIVLFVAFPASFYFSCFYTESLFFLLAVISLWAAKKEIWPLTALFCALLCITRVQGILLCLPILILLLQSMHWKLKNFPMAALWLLIIPLPLLLHLSYLQTLSGDFFAPVSAQAAWGKEMGNFKMNFIDVFQTRGGSVFKIDAILSLVFLLLAVLSFFILPSPAYGLYAFLIILLPILSGTSVSMTRYITVAFPAFITLAKIIKKEILIYSLAALFFAVQIFYFVGWTNYYWIS